MIKFFKLIHKIKSKIMYKKYISNIFYTNFKKNGLIVYITNPFFTNENPHSNYEQSRIIARILFDFKYNVDIIDYIYYKDINIENKKYDLIILVDINQYQYFAKYKNDKCKVVGYLTGSNLEFSNLAERLRLKYFYFRHNIMLKERRTVRNLYSCECVKSIDAFFLIGNQFTLSTYKKLKLKNVFMIANNANRKSVTTDINFDKKNSKSFLYLGSSGQILKGLDILLDVFCKNPDLKLYLCGGDFNERDFWNFYSNIIDSCRNIVKLGFLDIESSEFKDVVDECCYIVSLSSSEGCSGSVLSGMSYGLVPIITRETGVDSIYSVIVDDVNIENVENIIRQCSNIDLEKIKEYSMQNLRLYHDCYTINNFEVSFRQACKSIGI